MIRSLLVSKMYLCSAFVQTKSQCDLQGQHTIYNNRSYYYKNNTQQKYMMNT